MPQTNQYDPEIEAAANRIAQILSRKSAPADTPAKSQPTPAIPTSPARHPAMKPIQLLGVSSPEELAEKARIAREKKESAARRDRTRKPAANRKPRVDVVCPCGTVMHLAPWRAIYQKYCSPECRREYFRGSKPLKWTFTPEMDAELARIYREEVGITKRPVTKLLAEKFGVPAWKIKRRAYALGVVPVAMKRTKEPRWCEEEMAILKENATFTPERIQEHLRKAGFRRSRNAIRIKIIRNLGGKPRGEAYSLRELEKLFGIDGHGIGLWIRKGFLAATRRGTLRTEAQHGDTWDVQPADVRKFVVENVELVDFRKVDKFWLVDLLTGKGIQ